MSQALHHCVQKARIAVIGHPIRHVFRFACRCLDRQLVGLGAGHSFEIACFTTQGLLLIEGKRRAHAAFVVMFLGRIRVGSLLAEVRIIPLYFVLRLKAPDAAHLRVVTLLPVIVLTTTTEFILTRHLLLIQTK